MRNTTILLFLFLIIEGCKPYSYFISSNNLLNENCQVFLTDGTEIDGKLTVQFETGQYADKHLRIITSANIEERILITNIKYYKYKNDYYFPKEIRFDAYEILFKEKIYTPNINNILFLKRLTGENDKLQLFELFKSKNNSAEGYDQYDYYISFNNEDRLLAYSIRGNKFFPNFEVKMSKIVADCPSLAEKIQDNANGYTVKQISIDAKKNEVIKRIVEEYNKCE